MFQRSVSCHEAHIRQINIWKRSRRQQGNMYRGINHLSHASSRDYENVRVQNTTAQVKRLCLRSLSGSRDNVESHRHSRYLSVSVDIRWPEDRGPILIRSHLIFCKTNHSQRYELAVRIPSWMLIYHVLCRVGCCCSCGYCCFVVAFPLRQSAFVLTLLKLPS